MKDIFFRTDASISIGGGHVMRCLDLADEFKARGWRAAFICRDLPGHLFEVIKARGHRLFVLPAPTSNCTVGMNPDSHEINLGVTWKQDAEETCTVIEQSGIKPMWIVVDHYSLDRRWERTLGEVVDRILVIDDDTNRFHHCDLFLNQDLFPGIEESYEKLLPKKTKILLGPAYFLLAAAYRRARKHILKQRTCIKHVLVSYGSSDPTDETSKALSAIASVNSADIHVDVVTGISNHRLHLIEARVKSLPCATLHIQVPHLADLMCRADMAFCAGGNTVSELLFLGVPAIVTTTASNQEPLIQQLHKFGYLTWLGVSNCVSSANMSEEFKKYLDHPEELWFKSEKGWNLTDGRGVERVAAQMIDFSDKEYYHHALGECL